MPADDLVDAEAAAQSMETIENHPLDAYLDRLSNAVSAAGLG